MTDKPEPILPPNYDEMPIEAICKPISARVLPSSAKLTIDGSNHLSDGHVVYTAMRRQGRAKGASST